MIRDPWIDPRVNEVRLSQVRDYLLSHGFTLRDDSDEHRLLFEGPLDSENQPMLQILPATDDPTELRPLALDTITSLAMLEDRYAGDVLNDILAITPEEEPTSNGAGKTADSAQPQRS